MLVLISGCRRIFIYVYSHIHTSTHTHAGQEFIVVFRGSQKYSGTFVSVLIAFAAVLTDMILRYNDASPFDTSFKCVHLDLSNTHALTLVPTHTHTRPDTHTHTHVPTHTHTSRRTYAPRYTHCLDVTVGPLGLEMSMHEGTLHSYHLTWTHTFTRLFHILVPV